MISNKIRLLFDNVSEIAGTDRVGLITLADELKERMITIICDHKMAEAIQLRQRRHPLASLMLPEVAGMMFRSAGDTDFEIIISDLMDEQYKTYVFNSTTLDTFQIRASDAVLMSLTCGFPIYINRGLMLRQSVPYKSGGSGLSIPINVISTSMLQESLQRAINEEDYEAASKLRDELERRKNKGEHSL